MFRKIIASIFISCFLLVSCDNPTQDSTGYDAVTLNFADPDPITPDEISTAPEAPSFLLIVANVDGQIRSFYADNPVDYSIIVNDAATEEYFEEIKLSDDKNYLLYVNTERDLILYDIINDEKAAVVQENVSGSEIQFIDNDRIQFSYNAGIYCYTISTGVKYLLVSDSELFCNHGAVVSPDGKKIIFKNQDPAQTSYATYAWADVKDSTVTSCDLLGEYSGDIDLLEFFEFVWINNETVFLKPSGGVNTKLKSHRLGDSDGVIAELEANGGVINYSELCISNDLSKLCIFGSFGLYQLELSFLEFNSSINVNEIYISEKVIATEYASYSIDSDYLVAATTGCIGIYEAGSMKQTKFDSSKVISSGERLYSLDCK